MLGAKHTLICSHLRFTWRTAALLTAEMILGLFLSACELLQKVSQQQTSRVHSSEKHSLCIQHCG